MKCVPVINQTGGRALRRRRYSTSGTNQWTHIPFDDSYFRNAHSMTFNLVINKDIPKYESSNGMRTAQLLSIKLAATRCGGAHLVPINVPFDDSYFRNAHSMTPPHHARSLLSHGTPRP